MLRLLRRSKTPDRETLLRRHGGMVYGLCRRQAPESAEDCYQEVWEKVFAALPRFDPDGPATLRTWIGTIARRHLIDHHRRQKVRGMVREAPDLPSPGSPVDERIDTAYRIQRLEEALTHLPPAQRRVVISHHLQGVPLTQLAEEEGVAVGTIKSRLHRGRERLAQLLERT
ncbi:MAG: RNA polymerase sigma-70 factor (ECF subfamily) [Myxococcota bacterium]|jgi:RNA polymerase sigma-70 factor (ECF subfamily)